MGRKRKRRKRKGKRNGGASAKDIPSEILSDILSRLSVKSLVRFRCVSKYWCSIMSDPLFVDSHFTRSHDRPGGRSLLMSVTTYIKPVLSFFTTGHQPRNINPVHFLNQSNLVISKVSECLNGIIFLEHDGNISACNLSTREIITVPSANQEVVSSVANMLSFYSFGFDPATRQYKILKTWIESTSVLGVVTMHKILTLGTDSWRPIKCSLSIEFPKQESLCVNGAIHFRTSDLSGNMVIMAFDVGTENFRTIPLPEAASSLGHKSTLMKMKDSLAVLDYDQLLDYFSVMKMWTLDDYQNQVWRYEEVMLPYDWDELRGNCGAFLVSSIHTGKIILTPRFAGRSLFLLYYDMEQKRLRKVNIPGSLESVCRAGPYIIQISPIDYVETILSLREFQL